MKTLHRYTVKHQEAISGNEFDLDLSKIFNNNIVVSLKITCFLTPSPTPILF